MAFVVETPVGATEHFRLNNPFPVTTRPAPSQSSCETHFPFKSAAPPLHLLHVSGLWLASSKQVWQEASALLHQHAPPFASFFPAHSRGPVLDGAPSVFAVGLHFNPNMPLPDTAPPAFSQACFGMHWPFISTSAFLHFLHTVGTFLALSAHVWQLSNVGAQKHLLPFDESFPAHVNGPADCPFPRAGCPETPLQIPPSVPVISTLPPAAVQSV